MTQIVPNINTSEKFVKDIQNIIDKGVKQAYEQVAKIAVLTYWEIGRRIVEEEQHGQVRAQYGIKLIKSLAEQLAPKYGNKYSKRN